MPSLRYSGSQAIAGPTSGTNDAQLFAQLRTLRISQFNGFNFSTGPSISPLRAAVILANAAPFFMIFRELLTPLPRRMMFVNQR